MSVHCVTMFSKIPQSVSFYIISKFTFNFPLAWVGVKVFSGGGKVGYNKTMMY